MAETLAIRPQKRQITGWYYAGWTGLGLLALSYLAALAVKPELVQIAADKSKSEIQNQTAEIAALKTALSSAKTQANHAAQTAARAVAEKKSIALKLAALQEQLAAQQKAQADAQAQLQAPVAASETPPAAAGTVTTTKTSGGKEIKVEIVNAKQASVAEIAPSSKPPVAAAASAADNQPVEIAVPLPDRVPTGLRLKTKTATASPPPATGVTGFSTVVSSTLRSNAGIETGSISAPKSFGGAITRNAPATIGVRLSSGPSVDALRLAWSLLNERHVAELSGLEPRYLAGGPAAAPFELLAGPLPDTASATTLCAKLVARGVPCSVGAFAGNAL